MGRRAGQLARGLWKGLNPEQREGPVGQQLKRLELQADQAARGMPLPKGGAGLLAAMEAAELAVAALAPPPDEAPPPGPPAEASPQLQLEASEALPSPQPNPAGADPSPLPAPTEVLSAAQAGKVAVAAADAPAALPPPRVAGSAGTRPLGAGQPPSASPLESAGAVPKAPATGPLGPAGVWVGSSPLGQATKSSGSAPLRPPLPEAQPLAFAEAWRLGEALVEGQGLRFRILAMAMKAAALPGPGRAWAEATLAARQAAQEGGIPLPQGEWVPRLAQALMESPATVRQCHALQVQWESWLGLHAKAQLVQQRLEAQGPAADALVKAFPLEAYRAGLYALGRLHHSARGQAVLEAFWPPPPLD